MNDWLKGKWLAIDGWILAGLALTAVAVMYNRVRTFDRANRCDVLAGLSSADLAAAHNAATAMTSAETITVAAMAGPTTNVGEKVSVKTSLKVDRVDYDGDRQIRVVFNERPDMDVVPQYFRVGPMAEGVAGFRYSARYNYDKREYEPTVIVTGEFAFRTNVTLTIRKGFPLYGKGANPTAEGSLAEDFKYDFRRKDPEPVVAFADDGRYLPPGGREAIRISALNVKGVATEIRRVEPRNVVQLLAREEGAYRYGPWRGTADAAETDELSGLCETGSVSCANVPCVKETCLFPIAMKDGGPNRGIFLAAIRNGDRPRDENRWRNPRYNPNLYRLVCLSDLGLSVRKTAEGKIGEEGVGLGVWVTSLSSGKPVESAFVEIYSTANILVAEGATDGNGWCVPQRRAKGEPFAVVVRAQSKDDMTFLSLRNSMEIDETYVEGTRPEYLKTGEADAFVWTERGIYRHDEKIFVQAIVRNSTHRAPEPMPVVMSLVSPKGNVIATKTAVTDGAGTVSYDGFVVPAEQPSGKWKITLGLPGRDRHLLAEREVKVEEFAPPQIRVSVEADETLHPSNFAFRISAEHLFGSPASSLACEGAVVFEDVPFAPAGWKGFLFGNDELGLEPCFRRLSQRVLDDAGTCAYEAPLWADSGRPKAAVRATGQGVVFEDGGRPATARKSVICHYYPLYVGSNLPSWMRLPKTGFPKIDLVCVNPKGGLVKGERRLLGTIERIDSVYSYRKTDDGGSTWDCERIRSTVQDRIPISVGASGMVTYELPLKESGDYVFTATDPATGASFGRAFYLSDWGDNVVRAPLSNPTEVTIQPDKSFYRVGERPHLVVKSPFAGFALLSVMHQGMVYSEILNLTNATSEIVLRPVERGWAPNVDVMVSVVQSVAANARHLASRAHGQATVRVRPVENEIGVRLAVDVDLEAKGKGEGGVDEGGGCVTVDVMAPGATEAVVTLVDEGINLLTGEETPDPVRWFSRERTAEHPLYDLYNRILPVADGGLKASGVKTGGGFGAEMLGRVSPVPTRRFKPLALWREKVAIKDGKGLVTFDLPEFVGEVRVTAVAYSAMATGAASVRQKVSPKLVMQPDAPRFVAPGDTFEATLTLRNSSGKAKAKGEGEEEEISYRITVDGMKTMLLGRVHLAKGDSTNVVARLVASNREGEMSLVCSAVGLGETHATTIHLPVRPAVPWRGGAECVRVEPGKAWRRSPCGVAHRFAVTVGASQMAECAAALEWLADYPHGCLEQTSSRIFPLIAAGGILNAVASKSATNRAEYVTAGVRRVESMIRENDFVMWPDCNYPPWDREVSLYAAHFLVEAEKAGEKTDPKSRAQVMKFLRKWALSANVCESAYACHTLALAGAPDKDRMFRLYDARDKLDSLSRARLARAFAAGRDLPRAEALMKDAVEPQSVREAAFRVLALLDLNPDDARIPDLVGYLMARRDKARFSWGTTSENAHALLAVGAYYSHRPVRMGEVRVGRLVQESGENGEAQTAVDPVLGARESLTVDADGLAMTNMGPATAFLTVREMWLPDAAAVTNESNGIYISRRYLRSDGTEANLDRLVRGEMLIAELTVTSDVTRVVNDLVIEDLFAGAFEPVHREIDPPVSSSAPSIVASDWVMRKDVRDDRMLVFSKRFELKKDHEAKAYYPVRVVSAGDFVLPGPSVEGMYHPGLRSRRAPGRIVVRH